MSAGIRDSVPALGDGRVLDEASELGVDFYNDLGALTAGTLVYVSGWHTASNLPKVAKADADAVGKAATYVVSEALADKAIGVLRRKTKPLYTSLDTSLSTVGNPVYLSDTAGGFTLTAVGSGQAVGRVVTLHATRSQVAFDIEGAGTNGGAGGNTFFDSVFTIADDADDTKQMGFQVSGVTAGQKRIVTMPDTNVTLADIATTKADLAKIVSGWVTIANGATTAVQALGAATWDAKPVQVSFGAEPTAAGCTRLSASVAGGNLTVTANADPTGAGVLVYYTCDGR